MNVALAVAILVAGALHDFALGRGQTRKRCAAMASGIMRPLFAGAVLIDGGPRNLPGRKSGGSTMMIMSAIAGVINSLRLRLLRGPKPSDVNLRSATAFSVDGFVSNGGIPVGGKLVWRLGSNRPDFPVDLGTALATGGIEILRDARWEARQEESAFG